LYLQEWRVLLQLLEDYEATVAEIAKYVAAHPALTNNPNSSSNSSKKPNCKQLISQLSAEDLRSTIRTARSAGSSAAAGAGAAIADAERDILLPGMPGTAVLSEVADAGAAAVEAAGWLRPLKFDEDLHRYYFNEMHPL
jgi:hypothetical protein